MMLSFLLAIQFLTIIPIPIKHIYEKKMVGAMIYFPIIGLLLGLALGGINYLLCLLNFPQFSIDIILVVLLILFTGGIHLDGLADTSDAILSRKDKEEMLRIMRDPHLGVMGVLGIISILLLKISFLDAISPSLKSAALVLMCVLSRWALVLAMFIFPYARAEGKAKLFIQGINSKILTLATLMVLVLVVLFSHLSGILILAAVAISTYIIGKLISSKIGGLTGDSLGAINEIVEVSTLFFIFLFSPIWN